MNEMKCSCCGSKKLDSIKSVLRFIDNRYHSLIIGTECEDCKKRDVFLFAVHPDEIKLLSAINGECDNDDYWTEWVYRQE